MNIDRRHLVLPALAVGLVGIVPTFAASADEDAVAKSVEAFRVAQIAADAKAFDALCAAELSYSHSDGRVEDKATFIANATNGKSKFLSLEYLDPQISGVRTGSFCPARQPSSDRVKSALEADAVTRSFTVFGESRSVPGARSASLALGSVAAEL
jgi:hypothetical protein